MEPSKGDAITTLQTIVNNVRLLTNTENNQFITDNELAYYANASFGELDDILVANQQYYRLINTIINITSGNLMPLPSDCYQLNQVDFYYSPMQSQPWATIERFELKEQTMYSNSLARNIYGVPNLKYMLQDGYIAIVPEASAIGQYRVWYTPIYKVLALTDSVPSYFDNQAWTEYVVMDCCAKVLSKQDLDPSYFLTQKEALRIRVKSMSTKRDAGSPMHVANTRNFGYDGLNGIGGFGWGGFW